VEPDLFALGRSRALFAGETSGPPTNGKPATENPASLTIGAATILVLQEAGRPMHVDDLIPRLRSKGITSSKISIVSGLARMAKDGRLKRPRPSTYGLPAEKGERMAPA